VVERAEVDELDRDAAHDHLVRRGAHLGVDGERRREREAGPDALAAGDDQVAGDLGEEGVLGLDRLPQLDLDLGQVVRHRGGDHEGVRPGRRRR
jgi:hypothetical protein